MYYIPHYILKDGIHLIPRNPRVRSILYIPHHRAFLGYYKSAVIYKLPSHFYKIYLVKIWSSRCLIFHRCCDLKSLLVQLKTKLASLKVINQTNARLIIYIALYFCANLVIFYRGVKVYTCVVNKSNVYSLLYCGDYK